MICMFCILHVLSNDRYHDILERPQYAEYHQIIRNRRLDVQFIPVGKSVLKFGKDLFYKCLPNVEFQIGLIDNDGWVDAFGETFTSQDNICLKSMERISCLVLNILLEDFEMVRVVVNVEVVTTKWVGNVLVRHGRSSIAKILGHYISIHPKSDVDKLSEILNRPPWLQSLQLTHNKRSD
uniref:RNase H domain-containing protein n=1 Tax=Rhabditophanes sp. KR3021 TaxID=114890 RepID=A0AC35U8Y2_9BILA